MQAGALGIGSSLIYAPDSFASTEELIELCKVAAESTAASTSRTCGARAPGSPRPSTSSFASAARRTSRRRSTTSRPPASTNWPKMDRVLEMVEAARASGLKITADMYTYPAGSTGFNAAMPPWALDGGYQALFKRLRDPAERAKIKAAMMTPAPDWENLYLAAGSPERVLLVDFKNEKLKPLTGKTLAEVAKTRGTDPFDTILDLVLEDESRVGVVYFLMSEENIKKQLARPWVSLGSDAASMAPEGIFLKSSTHPRAYGNFARLLGKYVRQDGVMTMEEAIRRMTSLPASQSRADRSRPRRAGPLRRHRRLRSGSGRRPRDVRDAASARRRRDPRLRERRAGAESRRAHRQIPGTSAARSRPPALTRRPPAFMRVFSTDHKVVGLQYAITSLCFLLLGFSFILLIRWHLAWPTAGLPVVGGLFGEANVVQGIDAAGVLQPARRDARHGDGVPRGRAARGGRVRQLPRAAHDRRAGHGVPAAEHDELLAVSDGRTRHARRVLPARRCRGVRLDVLRAARQLRHRRARRRGSSACSSSSRRRSSARSTSS